MVTISLGPRAIKEDVALVTPLPKMECLSLESKFGSLKRSNYLCSIVWTATSSMRAVMVVGATSMACSWRTLELLKSLVHRTHHQRVLKAAQNGHTAAQEQACRTPTTSVIVTTEA